MTDQKNTQCPQPGMDNQAGTAILDALAFSFQLFVAFGIDVQAAWHGLQTDAPRILQVRFAAERADRVYHASAGRTCETR